MFMRRVLVGSTIAGLALLMHAVPAGATWMINKDVEQRLVTAQSNFETVLSGNATAGLSGGQSGVTNPFSNPQRTQSYDGTNTTISWSGSNSISQSFGTKRHFGIFGPGATAPKVIAEYWTPANNNTTGRVPGVGWKTVYPSGTGTATAQLYNDSVDQFTISKVGYRVVTASTLDISQLNQTGMPEGTFTTVAIPDSVMTPGSHTASFNCGTVTPDQCVVLLIQTHFTGASSSNTYNGLVREWVSNLNVPPLPGLGPVGMILLVLILASTGGWIVLRRNKITSVA
jgi:hypothetical protein